MYTHHQRGTRTHGPYHAATHGLSFTPPFCSSPYRSRCIGRDTRRRDTHRDTHPNQCAASSTPRNAASSLPLRPVRFPSPSHTRGLTLPLSRFPPVSLSPFSPTLLSLALSSFLSSERPRRGPRGAYIEREEEAACGVRARVALRCGARS